MITKTKKENPNLFVATLLYSVVALIIFNLAGLIFGILNNALDITTRTFLWGPLLLTIFFYILLTAGLHFLGKRNIKLKPYMDLCVLPSSVNFIFLFTWFITLIFEFMNGFGNGSSENMKGAPLLQHAVSAGYLVFIIWNSLSTHKQGYSWITSIFVSIFPALFIVIIYMLLILS